MNISAQSELSEVEAQAFHAIKCARDFAGAFRDFWVNTTGLSSRQINETLKRLDEAELFALQDESVWPLIERGLVSALNEIREGYGTYALRQDTRYDAVSFLPELECGRRVMEAWKHFKSARQVLIDQRRAARIATYFS